MTDVTFTPARERARHARLVARVRAGTLHRPVWVLCPRDALRTALEDRVARAGGAFARFVNWEHLALALDERLHLARSEAPDDTVRALAVERCLAARAAAHPDLADPLRSDPFGVALALLRVVDSLRLHRWDGRTRPPEAPADDRAAALVNGHVALLGDVLTAVEEGLAADGMLDPIARLRRALGALDRARFEGTTLLVEGVDRLAPLERDVLLAMRRAGADIDVAPWVDGWPHSLENKADATVDGVRDDGLLAALDAGAARCLRDDGSVHAVAVRDPWEEAEQVARWIAEEVARGAHPEDFAVHLTAEAGALDRMRRALERYGVPGNGVGATPVRQSVLWQVMRASVRLAWQGVDVVDLATVLSAPGSGIWGSDRDWLCAQLRRDVPTSWDEVRAVMVRATEPQRETVTVAPATTDDVTVLDLDGEAPLPSPDAARAAQLAETRARLEELLALWSSHGPFGRLAAGDRLAALTAVVNGTLTRFVNTLRFSEVLEAPRTQTAWIAAAQSIAAACRASLERLERAKTFLPPNAPGVFLASTESLLGATVDTPSPPRAEGVSLFVDGAVPARRPKTLVVTGFHRGRFPSPVGRALVLGPLERDALAALDHNLAALPTDPELGALAARETLRVLALPTERLVLVAPRRTSSGAEVDVALAWRDVLARLPIEDRERREREGVPWIDSWIEGQHPDGPRTARGRLLDAVSLLGAGEVTDAVARIAPEARRSVRVRDFMLARHRPEMRFDVGDLVQGELSTAVFTPRALESLLKCRYSFLTGALLGLKPLPLARAPSLGAQDRTKVTRAALRHLDAVAATGRAPTEDDAKRALDAAIESEIPWAKRGDMRLSLESLRRTVMGFLRRYLELRAVWKLDFANDATPREDQRAVPVALPSKHLPVVNLKPVRPRVETFRAQSPDGEAAQAIVMDLKLGGTASMAKLREEGLDLDAALVPAVLAAQQKSQGDPVMAFVRLSLSKPEGEVLAREADRAAPYEAAATTTVVTVDRARPLGGYTTMTLETLAKAIDDVSAANAEYGPHDEARHSALQRAGAKTCEYCAMRLGCRFKMAGGCE